MEVFDEKTGALRPECMAEIERYLSYGWIWGVLTNLCNRKWDTDFGPQELKRIYARSRRMEDGAPARGAYVAAALEALKEE